MDLRFRSFTILMAVFGTLLSGCGRTVQPATEADQPAQSLTAAAEPDQSPLTAHSMTPSDAPCSRIAFVFYDNDDGQIYTACPDGSELTQLTRDAARHNQPAWSPNGKQIAYASDASGTSQIYVMNADGSAPQVMTSSLVNDLPIWLPSGGTIAFRTTDGKGLWWWRTMNLQSREITQYSKPSYDFYYPMPSWSPDGRYLATMSLTEQAARNDGSSQIHITELSSGKETALTQDIWANVWPVFSPDSRRIAFFSERDGTYNVFALYVMALDGSGLQRVSEPMFDASATASWSPDGKEIIVNSLYSPKGTLIFEVENRTSRVFLDGRNVFGPAWGK